MSVHVNEAQISVLRYDDKSIFMLVPPAETVSTEDKNRFELDG